MNEFQVRLRRAMLASGLRQADLAKKAEISDSKVSCYMSGRYKPNAETISKLAAALGVTPAWLVGEGPDDLPALSRKALERSVSDAPLPFKDNRVNVIGEVAAGVPIAAQEDIVGTVLTDRDVFALRVKGDSMSPRIMDGDIVLVDQNACPDDGDVVIALVGDEATCKILKKAHDRVTLVPFNAAYPPFVYSGEEISDLHILGVVVEHRHSWR